MVTYLGGSTKIHTMMHEHTQELSKIPGTLPIYTTTQKFDGVRDIVANEATVKFIGKMDTFLLTLSNKDHIICTTNIKKGEQFETLDGGNLQVVGCEPYKYTDVYNIESEFGDNLYINSGIMLNLNEDKDG